MQIQELVTRGRLIFSGAPKRLEVFRLINGRRSSKEIAKRTGRSLSVILNDIQKMRDMALIQIKTDSEKKPMKKDKGVLYEKVPILRHIPISYFQGTTKIKKAPNQMRARAKRHSLSPIAVPSANEILDICKDGENQIYEFKDPRVKTEKITKEIAAFLHTKNGGLLFYGIEDDGSIVGSFVTRQKFDQSLQNSIRNTIRPQPNIKLVEKEVLGHKILVVIISPWDRKTLYQYTKNDHYYIRKGTNNFVLTPDEISKLGKGKTVV